MTPIREAGGEPWRAAGECRVLVRVRLTPKSSRDEIGGIETTRDGPALTAWVRAVPQDGAANAALQRLFSEWLHVPKSSVEIDSGTKSRIKTVAIEGDGAGIMERLNTQVAALGRAATALQTSADGIAAARK